MKLRTAIIEWFREHRQKFDLMSYEYEDYADELFDYIKPYFEKREIPMADNPSTIALTAKQMEALLVLHKYGSFEVKKFHHGEAPERLRDLKLITMGDGMWKLTVEGIEVAQKFLVHLP